jgi:hypothetical protein
MRIPVAGLGMAAAFFWTAAAALSQTLPYAGATAIDQPTSDSSLLPAGGITLEAPSGFDQLGGNSEGQARPSEGLELQIYESGSRTPSSEAPEGRERPGVSSPHPHLP